MLHKQLFAVACVVAIVAFGACMAGPNTPPPPPPPPLPPFMGNIRTMAVEVQDQSGGSPINTKELSRAMADVFDDYALRGNHVKVHVEALHSSRRSDATLTIVVHGKTSSCEGGNSSYQGCEFQMLASSILMAADGTVLWQETDEKSLFEGFKTMPQGLWENHALMWLAANALRRTILPNLEADR